MAEQKPKPEPKPETDPPISTWGTLEDLLLACAVNRHGVNAWDSIANELNHRRTTNFTPNICRLKFLDLQRRFSAADGGGDAGDGDETVVWVDELRRLRVAELKRDLHRYDLSIVSLQLKVKRLKEERENSLNEEERENNSDLKKTDEPPPENGRIIDESSNESISLDRKPDPIKPDPEQPIRGGDSCNGSSNSKENEPVEPDPADRVDRVDLAELGESVAESGRGGEGEGEGEGEVKENSDVQSTASLRRREKKLKGISGNSSGDENQSLASKFSIGGSGGGSGAKESSKRKSKGLLDFLDLLRARKCGSVFERRLETQETPRYKSLIKEHIDLGIIQKRVEEGRYTDCHTMFYRDLMLLVNNAIVFFHKRSSEYKYAAELRLLVTQHFQTHLNIKSCRNLSLTPPAAPPTQSIPEVDQATHVDLKPKLAITGPVIACRKRSSIAGKLSSSAPEKKESSPGTVLKKDAEKSSSTSFNAVATKRARDQSSGPRNSTSKSRPSSNQKSSPRISSKGEISEAKAETKNSKSKQGSRPGKDLLLDVLDSEVKRKIFGNNVNGSGSFRSDRHKDHGRGSSNGTNKKSSTEKGKGKEEKESPRSKNNGRPPKKATTVVITGKRGADGVRDSDTHAKKRQRR